MLRTRNTLLLAVSALILATLPAPATQLILDNNAGWSESIQVVYNREIGMLVGSPVFRSPHQGIAPVASYGHCCSDDNENVNRSVHIFTAPDTINNDEPYSNGFMVQSATLYISLQYGWCSWNQYPNMPGVKAYYIDMVADNNDPNNVIDPDDFGPLASVNSPALIDLGYIVPAGGSVDNPGNFLFFDPNTSAQGEYSIDVTDALRDAVASNLYYLPIRLQLGGETEGETLDANINIDYVFKHASNSGYGGPPLNVPRLEVVLNDEITNCTAVHEFGHGYISDLNMDCRVNLVDFAMFAAQFGLCNDPVLIGSDPGCASNW
jgi:hypothetical protein